MYLDKVLHILDLTLYIVLSIKDFVKNIEVTTLIIEAFSGFTLYNIINLLRNRI